ncbi:hydrogenase maturation protease [Methanopyrus sp.]
MEPLRDHLRELLEGGFVLIGLGNPLAADDGFGYWVARRLSPLKTRGFEAVAAGVWLERLRPPSEPVVLVDAVRTDREPGTLVVVKEPRLGPDRGSHGLPPDELMDVRLLIGFVPVRSGFGPMSPEAKSVADSVVRVVRDVVLEGTEGPTVESLRGGAALH